MRDIKFFKEIIFNFKGILFRNQDIISGVELVEYGIVSKDTKNILKSLKKLRKLNNIYYVWDYNKEFKRLIYSYKYSHRKIMAKLIAELIKEEFYYVLKREKIDVVVSVPVSRKRKNERGYNQVDEILNCLKVNYVRIERIKNTKHMYTLKDNKKREKNVQSAFKNSLNLENKNVLIVDDIVTSGATINSISEELRKNNENINIKVFSIAIARHFIME